MINYKLLLSKYIQEVDNSYGDNPETIFNLGANWNNVKDNDITFEEACELVHLYHYPFGDEPLKIKQTCLICEKKFEGPVKIDICPKCYV